MTILAESEPIDDFAAFGIRAFTTTRHCGNFGLASDEPTKLVMQRWRQLREELKEGGARIASATQVHGTRVAVHDPEWEGWLRVDNADGHATTKPELGLVVGIADCVPVFIAHPRGAIALLHSGWRGTAGRIVEQGIATLRRRGFPAAELRIHLGPAICGNCYEVGANVYQQLTGRAPAESTSRVDLRCLIAEHAREAGVRHISASALCTRCNNDRLFSHRAGDAGRQVAVIIIERGRKTT